MLFAVASLGAATDSTAQTCLESVYLGFAEAQRAWQVSLKNLIVSARPDYDELVSLSAELQLAMIEENQARFMYLITQQSDRVRSAGDLSQLVNLGGAQWTSGDEKALLAVDLKYRALSARTDSLRRLNDGHPDWPALRAYFASELSKRVDYAEALERFQKRQAELEEELANCTSG